MVRKKRKKEKNKKRKKKKGSIGKVYVWNDTYFWDYKGTSYILDALKNLLIIARNNGAGPRYKIPLKEDTKQTMLKYIFYGNLRTMVKDLSKYAEWLLRKWASR